VFNVDAFGMPCLSQDPQSPRRGQTKIRHRCWRGRAIKPLSTPLFFWHDLERGATFGAALQKEVLVTKRPPIIYIIDDDESIRLSLDSLFRSVGFATQTLVSAEEFLAADRPDTEACLVLDIRLKGTSGLDFQEQLAGSNIRMPVILMTGHGDIPMSVRGMKAGAVDFLTKPFRDQDMLDAVASALKMDGKRRASQGMLADIEERFQTLTSREQQVMLMVTQGLLNKQVAGNLGISEVTVKIHRGSAMKKMGARTLPDLVRMADVLKQRGLPDAANTTV
jgi:FixJ family two-component response regulator